MTKRTCTGATDMLLLLTQLLAQEVRAFNVFSYITLRAVLGTLTSLAITFVIGPPMIRKLTAYKIGQAVRSDGPQTHLTKAGTPTMGGALILLAVAIASLLWMDLNNRYMWIVLGATLAFGAIGFYDDFKKIVLKNSRGLAARWKYLWQSVFALAVAIALYT